MAQSGEQLPHHGLVLEVIACAGLAERVAAELGDDVLERDLLVMRAAQWTSTELADQYEWLSANELASLRRAAGAETGE